MTQLVETFIAALHALERERDVTAMCAMFEADATLRRAPRERTYEGTQGTREFWDEYLDAFEEVETEFDAVTESNGRAALEWHSNVRDKAGQARSYQGCTVIEGETRVRSFRTYYDAAAAGMGRATMPAAGVRDHEDAYLAGHSD